MFGIEHVNLVGMAFPAKQGAGFTQEHGTEGGCAIRLCFMGIVASQTGDVSVGDLAAQRIEQGKRDGFCPGRWLPGRWPSHACGVTATDKISVGGDACDAVAAHALAGDHIAAHSGSRILVRHVTCGAGTRVDNGFASKILRVGMILS